MKRFHLLLSISLLFYFSIPTSQTLIPIAGKWQFDHLDINTTSICCPFNRLTIEKNDNSDSFFPVESWTANFKISSEPDLWCSQIMGKLNLEGVTLNKVYDNPNKTAGTVHYRVKEYEEPGLFDTQIVEFQLENGTQILRVEYQKKWLNDMTTCGFTMKKDSGISGMQALMIGGLLVIVLIGALVGLRKFKENKGSKLEREKQIRGQDIEESFVNIRD